MAFDAPELADKRRITRASIFSWSTFAILVFRPLRILSSSWDKPANRDDER
jgi:hypothetical protein